MSRYSTYYHLNRDVMRVDFCNFDRNACPHGLFGEHYTSPHAALKLREKVLVEIEEKYSMKDGVASESAAAALLPRELAMAVGV